MHDKHSLMAAPGSNRVPGKAAEISEMQILFNVSFTSGASCAWSSFHLDACDLTAKAAGSVISRANESNCQILISDARAAGKELKECNSGGGDPAASDNVLPVTPRPIS